MKRALVEVARRVAERSAATRGAHEPAVVPAAAAEAHALDLGRERLAAMRRNVKGAVEGAISCMP